MTPAHKAAVRGLTNRARVTLRDQLVRFFEGKKGLTGNEQVALSLLQADEHLTLEFGTATLKLAGVDQEGKRAVVTLHMT